MSSSLSISSLPNPLTSDDDQNPTPPPANDQVPSPPTAAVKDDLSAIGHSIGRQLRGVAAFFAPPPLPHSPSPPESDDSEDDYSSQALVGIKNDLAEIGGSLRSSFSRLASNLLQLEREDNELKGDEEEEEEESEDYEVPGTSDDVLDYVLELSLRPELWTDFPLPLDNDFHMSDAQQGHASTIEVLVPRFATFRATTCSQLSEGKFWMIYFILLLPRLHEDDIDVLSTPEILKTRELLLQKLQNERNEPVEASGDVTEKELKTDNENIEQCSEEQGVDASTSRATQKQSEDEKEFSCIDLGGDNNDRFRRMPTEHERVPSPTESNEWVRPGECSRNQCGGRQETGPTTQGKGPDSKESNEWINPTEQDRVPSPTELSGWVRVSEHSQNQGGGGRKTGLTPRGKGSDSEDSNGWLNVDEVDI